MKKTEKYREINWGTTSFYLLFVYVLIFILLADPELTDLEITSPKKEFWFYAWVLLMITIFINLSSNPITELTANDKSVTIRKYPFGLLANTINLNNIITIMRDSNPPDNEPNMDVRDVKWYGFGSKWLGYGIVYPDRILIRYIEEGREKEIELYVKYPDKLFDWLQTYVCSELSQSPTVEFDEDTTILFHRKGTYHDSYE